jgi:hypothetical protein
VKPDVELTINNPASGEVTMLRLLFYDNNDIETELFLIDTCVSVNKENEDYTEYEGSTNYPCGMDNVSVRSCILGKSSLYQLRDFLNKNLPKEELELIGA